MRYFPVFLDTHDRVIVLAGSGEKALQKLRLIARSEAAIRIVGELISPELGRLARESGAEIVHARFNPRHLEHAALVFAAHENAPELDRAVVEAARAAGVPVNVVDTNAACDFFIPAIVDRDPVVVAIGTEGTAPVLARDIKAKLEAMLPSRLGLVARAAGALRERLKADVRDGATRRRIWERLLTGRWRQAIMDGRDCVAGAEWNAAITDVLTERVRAGSVSLIGTGPGDGDLLTLKAQQRLQEADVLVIDRLVTPEILDYARRDAVRIEVGKEGYGPSTPQSEINQILIREALKGHRVARLKGGDSFIFARAAEEMGAVRAAGIPVEIVPGLTAAHACAASIGLPLTLRGKVRRFSVVAGATADGDARGDAMAGTHGEFEHLEDWTDLARPGHAFAIYMGVATAAPLRAKLIAAGADPTTSVVIVEKGTRRDERAIHTDLDHLPAALRAHAIKGPAILFVGLDWEQAGLSRPAHVRTYPSTTHSDLLEHTWSAEAIARATSWVAG